MTFTFSSSHDSYTILHLILAFRQSCTLSVKSCQGQEMANVEWVYFMLSLGKN